jgi:hypothetical protein
LPYPRIDAALAQLAAQTSAVRLRSAEADIRGLRDPRLREIAAVDRAGAFVWLAGALEQFVADFVDSVITELNSLLIPQSDLRESLFCLLQSPTFDRLQAVRGDTMWTSRIELLESLVDPRSALFNPDIVPIASGATIHPDHFDLLWRVFGLPGISYPSGRHRGVLRDLATSRNAVAHGQLDPHTFGRTRTLDDVQRVSLVVDDFGEHAAIAGAAYFDTGMFRR